MDFGLLQNSVSGKVYGRQLDLELLEKDKKLGLADHMHKEPPSIAWQLATIRSIAVAAGVESDKFAMITCSDEVNYSVKLSAHQYGGAFDLVLPGGPVNFSDLEIGTHSGHDRQIVLNLQHIGEYKLPTTKDTLLYGMVRGDQSHVNDNLRGCCGKLLGMLELIRSGKPLPENFEQLSQHAEQFVHYDLDDPKQLSQAMWHITVANLGIQARKIIDGLASLKHQDGEPKTFLVASGIAINRHFKYAQPLVLADLHIVKGGKVYDLSKQPYPVSDAKAAKLLTNISDY